MQNTFKTKKKRKNKTKTLTNKKKGITKKKHVHKM